VDHVKILWWARIASLVGGVLILVGTAVAGFVSNYWFGYSQLGIPNNPAPATIGTQPRQVSTAVRTTAP